MLQSTQFRIFLDHLLPCDTLLWNYCQKKSILVMILASPFLPEVQSFQLHKTLLTQVSNDIVFKLISSLPHEDRIRNYPQVHIFQAHCEFENANGDTGHKCLLRCPTAIGFVLL
jgi:hypothetical protein